MHCFHVHIINVIFKIKITNVIFKITNVIFKITKTNPDEDHLQGLKEGGQHNIVVIGDQEWRSVYD